MGRRSGLCLPLGAINMFRDQIIQWLRDGDDDAAARLLSDCEISLVFVDLALDMAGDRDFEIYDAEILAPRAVLDRIDEEYKKEQASIESAMTELAHTYHWHFRSISWLPAPPTVKSPVEEDLGQILSELDSAKIQRYWEKAISRRVDDPDGAITAARSLLESVCKFILKNEGVEFSRNTDLLKLYRMTVEILFLTPEFQENESLRQAMGNAQSIVNAIAALRNLKGDAHGTAEDSRLPSPHIAEFAVNISGSLSKLLLDAWLQSVDDNGP